MTVQQLATELGLWETVGKVIRLQAGRKANRLLQHLGALPVKRSRAARRLGSYVSRNGRAVCVRLQFAQEPESLRQTLLHEIAHFCQQQTNQRLRREPAHGPQWQAWALALGIPPTASGNSEALQRLRQLRLKRVAVCSKCGFELRRMRRLDRNKNYLHRGCGGDLSPV